MIDKDFQPDYHQILEVLYNRKPDRLPLYEHHIDLPFIENALNKTIQIEGNRPADFEEYYTQIAGFWRDMTYDAFDYEAAICEIFPGHGAINGGKKFLLHSCGKIFEIMEDLIGTGIEAKHSNEDEIAPFETWIENYNDRIGLFGGIDVNTICLNKKEEVFRIVLEKASRFRNMSKGYGLGSGNSIAGYVPVEGFLAMVEAAVEIRKTT